MPKREDGVDQIVPGALLAQLDFQAVGEEGEEVDATMRSALFAEPLCGLDAKLQAAICSRFVEAACDPLQRRRLDRWR